MKRAIVKRQRARRELKILCGTHQAFSEKAYAAFLLAALVVGCGGQETGQSTGPDDGGASLVDAQVMMMAADAQATAASDAQAPTTDALIGGGEAGSDTRPPVTKPDAMPDVRLVTSATIEPAVAMLGSEMQQLRFTVTNTGTRSFVVQWAGLAEAPYAPRPGVAEDFGHPTCFAGPFLNQGTDPDHCGNRTMLPGGTCHVDVSYQGSRGCAPQRTLWLSVAEGPNDMNRLALAQILVVPPANDGGQPEVR